jgi:hypothetical protein
LWNLWNKGITWLLALISIHLDLISRLLNHFPFLSYRFDQVVDFLRCVRFERVFNRRNIFLLFSPDFVKLLLLFLSISHFTCLFFLLLQNCRILVSSLLGNRNRLDDIFVNNIKFVVLVDFLNFLLVLLQFYFCQILLPDFFLQNIGGNLSIVLNSPCRLFFVLLCQLYFVWLLN